MKRYPVEDISNSLKWSTSLVPVYVKPSRRVKSELKGNHKGKVLKMV